MKIDEDKTIGERIAVARERYRLSQRQLGANLGLTRAAISQYEQDKIRPRAKIIEKLAQMFHADPEWFERGRGKAPDEIDAPVVEPGFSVGGMLMETVDLSVGWAPPTSISPPPTNDLFVILAPNAAGPIHRGDKVLIDGRRRYEGAGVYLIIDAARPRLRHYKAEPDSEEVRSIGRAIAYLQCL